MLEANTCLMVSYRYLCGLHKQSGIPAHFLRGEQPFYPSHREPEGSKVILTGAKEFFCTLSYIQE